MSHLVQGSPEWLEMRRNYIGASDAPVVMEKSPWKTPYQLWQEKLNLVPVQEITASMQRGNDLEAKARAKFEEMTGLFVLPAVVMHPVIKFMMASFDGMDVEKKNIVEIKCPGKEDHTQAEFGQMPEKYYAQLQHQLEVAQLDKAYYFSFDGENGVIIPVFRDDKYIKAMVAKESTFYDCIQSFTAPEMTRRDFQYKDDQEWASRATQLLSIRALRKNYEKLEQSLESQLVEMAEGKNCMGFGVRVAKIARKGNVDYSTIPALEGLDLNQYRKPVSEYWMVKEG